MPRIIGPITKWPALADSITDASLPPIIPVVTTVLLTFLILSVTDQLRDILSDTYHNGLLFSYL